MKNLFLSLFLLSLFQGFSQKIKIKVLNQKDTTVHLIRYYGEKLYYADTAEMKNGQVVFEGTQCSDDPQHIVNVVITHQ